MAFAFPPRTVSFLAELRENNTREWFEAHRGEYHSAYLEPAREFVTTVGPPISEMAPGIVADPRVNGSILRINRDLRFCLRAMADDPGLAEVRASVEAAGVPVSSERGGLVAIATEPPALASDPSLVQRCLEIWSAVAPLHRWLAANG